MNDGMNLKDWLSIHEEQDEVRSLFYLLDKRMKYIHGRGYYISKFNLDKIEIKKNMVDFLEVDLMSRDSYQEAIDSNVYTMACLEVASYARCLEFFNPKFLTESFDEFVPFIPHDDVPYYRGVFQDKKYRYFSDYADLLEQAKEKQNFGEDQDQTNQITSNTRQKSYVKATSAGKLYQGDDTQLNQAAFANVILLTTFVVFTTFITVLGIILFSLK